MQFRIQVFVRVNEARKAGILYVVAMRLSEVLYIVGKRKAGEGERIYTSLTHTVYAECRKMRY